VSLTSSKGRPVAKPNYQYEKRIKELAKKKKKEEKLRRRQSARRDEGGTESGAESSPEVEQAPATSTDQTPA